MTRPEAMPSFAAAAALYDHLDEEDLDEEDEGEPEIDDETHAFVRSPVMFPKTYTRDDNAERARAASYGWSTDRENRILPGLYIGGIDAAKSKVAYDLVVNLSGIEVRSPERQRFDGRAYIAWPIDDSYELPDLDALWRIARIVADTLRSPRKPRVLVHCAMGINRSALLCAAVVMLVRNTSGKRAMATVRKARRGALANRAFAAYIAGHGRPTKRRTAGIYWPAEGKAK